MQCTILCSLRGYRRYCIFLLLLYWCAILSERSNGKNIRRRFAAAGNSVHVRRSASLSSSFAIIFSVNNKLWVWRFCVCTAVDMRGWDALSSSSRLCIAYFEIYLSTLWPHTANRFRTVLLIEANMGVTHTYVGEYTRPITPYVYGRLL